MRILAVETSCDETSLALVEAEGGFDAPKFDVRELLISSQIETHRPWGGVVPNLAKRGHAESLPKLFTALAESLPRAKSEENIKLIAVTVGPGLEPCLWQGIEFAKKIGAENFPDAELVPTNHLHGHMYSFLLPQKENSESPVSNSEFFPAVQLLVSGGNTMLILMRSLVDLEKIGETLDDAAGEAFDKVARMLGLFYPGGPEIERIAALGKPDAIAFPRPMLQKKNYDFSFSGLKTAVRYHLEKNVGRCRPEDIAASFQKAVLDILITKTLRAAEEYDAKSVILSGGVACNAALQIAMQLETESRNISFFSADKKFQGDNAAMIAAAGYITHLQNKKYPPAANGSLKI